MMLLRRTSHRRARIGLERRPNEGFDVVARRRDFRRARATSSTFRPRQLGDTPAW